MNTALIHTEEAVDSLKQFHLNHFPNQPVPAVFVTSTEGDRTANSTTDEHAIHDLGQYPDGTRRTLTDEQIAMFRNSEIQRLLNERRRQQEIEDNERYDEEQSDAEDGNQQQARQHQPEQEDVQDQRKRRFADDVVQDSPVLMYDDEPTKSAAGNKQFLWPKLG